MVHGYLNWPGVRYRTDQMTDRLAVKRRIQGQESNLEPSRMAQEATTPRRRSRSLWIALGVALVVVVVFTAPLAGVWGLPYHQGCRQGSRLASERLWTPVGILNAPFNGSANATALRTSGGKVVTGIAGSVNASNGSTVGLFSLNTWNIYAMSSVWEVGPGSSSACSSAASVQLSPDLIPTSGGSFVSPVLLSPSGGTTTSVVDNFTLAGYASVLFDASYNTSAGQQGGHGTCAGQPISYFTSVEEITVSIPYGTGSISTTISDLVSYAYYLGPNGGWFWQLTPSAGWAFDYTPCPG